ncbi:GumC family protein [Dankookia sp. GCM10030260]|uniref:GumC family protein n=1 Tax=Dankookia sp. GCM10030260 TaxID=3273390 RepID=UPI0036D22897
MVQAEGERIVANAMLAIWRHRYLVIGCLLLSLLLAIGALAVLKRTYVSEAILQLDLSRREAGFGSDQSPAVALDAGSLIQSELRIIRSRQLARQVVERLGLADDPAYAETPSGLEYYAAWARTWAAEGLAWMRGKPPPNSEPFTTDAAARATADVVRGLSVGSDPRSYLISITFASQDPTLSARIANAVADEYLHRRAQSATDAASRAVDWMTAQINEVSEALRASEADIAAFRNRTGLMEAGTNDGESVQQQQLRTLAAQVAAANLTRLNEERRVARIEEVARSGQVPSPADLPGASLIPVLLDREVAARRELSEALSRLGSRHPTVLQAQAGLADLRGRLDAEVRRAVVVAQSELAAIRHTETGLRQQMEVLQRAMVVGKADEIELHNRLTKAAAVRDRLAALTRSREQALTARELRPTTASLAVPAEPERTPTSPKPLVVFGLALVGGLGTGIAAAGLLQRRDRGFRTSEEIRDVLDTRCLGMLPDLMPKPEIAAGTPSAMIFDEAIYAIGAGVNLFGTVRDCRVVLVTSALPGEGKSTLCMALAQALTAAGQRVMLINSPRIRSGSEPTAPTATATGGDPSPARAVGPALVVIERKQPMVLLADVFGPDRIGSLLQEARKHFDVILLEGAPVMLAGDSLALGRLADTVIHVAQWGGTRRRIVTAALRRLQEHAIGIDGIVLTRVNLRQHARLKILDECFFYAREKDFHRGTAGAKASRHAAPPSGLV